MFDYRILYALLDAINECGTIMSMGELRALAFGPYGSNEYIEDADGNVVEVNRVCTRNGLQEIADIYTDGFDCMNF